MTAAHGASVMREALEQAATYHFLSLLFQPPGASHRAELLGLAATLPGSLSSEAVRLATAEAGDEYHRLLGASGACPDCESSYEDNPLSGKGPLIADIAGFYQAFRFQPEDSFRSVPDHISLELGFLGYLALKEAYAYQSQRHDEVDLCREAATSFLREHVGSWVPAFLDRVEATGTPGFYADAARFMRRALAALGVL